MSGRETGGDGLRRVPTGLRTRRARAGGGPRGWDWSRSDDPEGKIETSGVPSERLGDEEVEERDESRPTSSGVVPHTPRYVPLTVSFQVKCARKLAEAFRFLLTHVLKESVTFML